MTTSNTNTLAELLNNQVDRNDELCSMLECERAERLRVAEMYAELKAECLTKRLEDEAKEKKALAVRDEKESVEMMRAKILRRLQTEAELKIQQGLGVILSSPLADCSRQECLHLILALRLNTRILLNAKSDTEHMVFKEMLVSQKMALELCDLSPAEQLKFESAVQCCNDQKLATYQNQDVAHDEILTLNGQLKMLAGAGAVKELTIKSPIQPDESQDDLSRRLDVLEKKWCTSIQASVQMHIQSLCGLFDVKDVSSLCDESAESINAAYAKWNSYLHELRNRLPQRTHTAVFTKISQVFKSSYLTVMLLLHTNDCIHSNKRTPTPASSPQTPQPLPHQTPQSLTSSSLLATTATPKTKVKSKRKEPMVTRTSVPRQSAQRRRSSRKRSTPKRFMQLAGRTE